MIDSTTMNILKVKNPEQEEEREIFNIDRSDRKVECPTKKVKVSFFDMIISCFKGKGYVEVEVEREQDAFEKNKPAVATIKINEEDI